jgi:hypothetical protein
LGRTFLIQYNGPIFLHPPKTAGSSIVNALVQSKIAVVNDDVNFDEFLIRGLHQTFKEFGYPADAEYSISVRSPYTRYVSVYYEFCWSKKHLDILYPKDSSSNITRFNRYLLNTRSRGDVGSSPCSYWLEGITGNINIIKFENLVADVNRVYKIDLESFPHMKRHGLRTGAPVNDQESIRSILKFYDDSVIGIINDIAQSDFTAFGYTKFNNYQEMIDYAQT